MFTDDQDIERTLKAALNVQPSDGFEAGVRQRLEQEPPARRAAVPSWLAAAAAVTLLAGGWYVAQRDADPVDPVHRADNVTPAAPVPDVPPQPVEPAAVRPPAPGIPSPSRPATHAARRSEPEVIVPANQLEIVRRLVREVHAGRVQLPEPAPAAAEPSPLVVEPLVIDPLSVSSLGTGSVPEPILKGLQ